MPAHNIAHSGVLHPSKALLGVHLSIPSSSNEPIALQPPTSHEDKNAESRVAEAEARWQQLAVRSDECVDFVDVAVVHFAESDGKVFVAACELFEGLWDTHPEQAAEGRVARDASLAVSQDVDGAHVPDLAVGGFEMLHHCGVVVVGDGARVVDAEGIKGVSESRSGFDRVERFVENDLLCGDSIEVSPAGCTEEGDVVCQLLAQYFC